MPPAALHLARIQLIAHLIEQFETHKRENGVKQHSKHFVRRPGHSALYRARSQIYTLKTPATKSLQKLIFAESMSYINIANK